MLKTIFHDKINFKLQAIYLIGLLGILFVFFKYPVEAYNKVFGLYLFTFSLILSLNLVPVFRFIANTFNIVDDPDHRKTHLITTPLLGGVAVYFSIILTIIIFHDRIGIPVEWWWIIGSGTIILAIGLMDDIFELSSQIRLLVQFFCAAIVVWHGVRISFFPQNIIGDSLEIILSMLWIIGITNAINFLDGMDGLASGYIIITASLLGFVAYQLVMPEYLYFLLVIIGSCLGFFPFNFRFKKSALIFLGDSGATFLGFIMGCLTILGKWGSKNDYYNSLNELGVVIPLIILGVAVFDTIFTIANRIIEGKIKKVGDLLSYAGRDHFHHRLNDIGLKDKYAVGIIFLITLCLGLGSIALKNARRIDAILILIQAMIVFFLIGFFMNFVKRNFFKK